jgi:glycosyltransferase involved in cell wall biosynthesis
MKILIPSLHYPPVIGGFEIFTQNIAEKIGKTDDIFVVTCRVINTVKQEQKDKLIIYRTSPRVLKDLSRSSSKFVFGSMVWIFFKSWRLIKKEKIELMHAQGFLSGIICCLLKKATKIPYVFTIQSADFGIYHKKLNFWPIAKIYGKLEKSIFKNAKYCHAISRHLEKHLQQHGAKNTIVIPNGVDITKFIPVDDKMQLRKELGYNTKNLIVCVSRLEHKNGTYDLIEAANYLQKEISDFKIVICGSGSQQEELQKMINKFGLENKIFLLGSVLYNKIPQYMAMADIFIRPSLAEGFGNVFIEAMATGTPVIGTPVGGIVDFLKDPSTSSGQATGVFCEPGNPKDIAEKINLLLTDKNLAKLITENGLKMAREKYDWHIIAQQIRELYLKVLK